MLCKSIKKKKTTVDDRNLYSLTWKGPRLPLSPTVVEGASFSLHVACFHMDAARRGQSVVQAENPK